MSTTTEAQKTPQGAHKAETAIWPEHYAPEDIKAIAVIRNWMNERNYSQAALARLARISGSSLNQILKGVYLSPPRKPLTAIRSAMRHADESVGIAAPVETSVFRLGGIACDMARRYRNFAVFTGYVGTGKTFAVKHYAANHPNTYVIEASPTMTPQSLIKQLARMVAGLEKGSIANKFDGIVENLANTDSLIIVDEAETLTPHQLHTIRRIRDLANIGIVLCGTEHLSGLIKPLHGQFDQIRSRAGFWPETVHAITAEDAAALTQSAFGAEEVAEDVIARLHAYAKGSARMLVEGLIAAIREFRKGRPLDVRLVDAVARQALCLSGRSVAK
ncbi:MAG: AAA family ATPase [Zoogloeaceae bacterium]|jgi:DNA transposition AAA+ family ATPase|nr:AAA family ATPase [Zoogloeaceae bacterium]